MTGFPAAIAAAKSPPEALPKAKGKLLGPKTQTGPSDPKHERMLFAVSMTGCLQLPVRAARAAILSCEWCGAVPLRQVGESWAMPSRGEPSR
jgi:hypothetical protein